MTNQQKTAAARTVKILIPLGAAGALVAGCGGGGGGMSAALPHQNTSSGTSPVTGGGAQTTALLTITIPARGAQPQSAKRHARYISPASTTLGVTIASAAQPSPTPAYFTVPTPGPSPISTTLPVGAPVGTDTVTANIYDAKPGPSASPNLLSTGKTTATIGTGSPAVAVQTLGVAAGVILAGPSPNPTSIEFFENHGAAQSVALTATAVDADGYAIPGTLASPVPVQAPAGVSLAPSSLTAGGATALTATYAAGQSGTGGPITGGLPLDTAAGSSDNYTIEATQYVFVATAFNGANDVSVVDPVTQTLIGTFALPSVSVGSFAVVAVAGCSTGETTVVSATQGFSAAVTLPPPGSSTSSVAAVDLTATIAPRAQGLTGAAVNYLAADTHCGVYSAADSALTRYSGFGATVAGTAVTATGWTANDSIVVAGSTIYGTTLSPPNFNINGGANTLTVQSLAAAGGTAAQVGTPIPGSVYAEDIGLCAGGTSLYELNGNCSGSYQETYALTTIPSFTSTAVPEQENTYACAPNGTVYLFVDTVAAQAAPIVQIAGSGGAVSSDGRYLAVVSYPSGSSVPALQIESTSSTVGGTPTPIGTPIPLTGAADSNATVAFPR